MQKSKNRGSIANILFIVCIVSYIFMHLFFTYVAFTSFKLWFTAVVFLAPVVGDVLLIGATTGAHNLVPLIWFCITAALYFVSAAIPGKQQGEV